MYNPLKYTGQKLMPEQKSSIIQTKSGKGYILRSFQAADAEALQHFLSLSAFETQHTLRYKEENLPICKLLEKINFSIESNTSLNLGVFDSGKLIAQLMFRIALPEHPWMKHVGEFGMTVLRDYWNQGIGTALLLKMENFAKEVGVTRVEAKVRTKNDRGLNLYRKAGYHVEGTRKNAVLIDEVFQDEFFIAKLL
jgi:predicted acetyltransferase